MAVSFVSGPDAVTGSSHSHGSAGVQPKHSASSQEPGCLLASAASPSVENHYWEITAGTAASGSMAAPLPDRRPGGRPERCTGPWIQEYRGGGGNLPGPLPVSATARPGQHPRLPDPRVQRSAPPKPRRLYAAGQDIYTVPAEKRKDPFDRRHTWSPLAMAPGASQLHKMRCYRSNEQLDATEGELEQLDTISNSSAPPKIAPQSGKLNKMSPVDIIKPVAFKPITKFLNRFAASRPSPPQSALPSWSQPLTSDLNRSHDDGYQSQDGNHVGHRDCAAMQRLPQAPSNTSVSSSQFDGQASCAACPTDHATYNTSHASPGVSHASLDRNCIYSSHAKSALLKHANNMACNASHSSLGRRHGSLDDACGPSNSSSHALQRPGHASLDGVSHSLTHAVGTPSDLSRNSLNTSRTSSNLSQTCSSDGSHVSLQMAPPSCHASPAGTFGCLEDAEAALREKESEIRHLRETLERNERALLQVYEEKRQNWEAELRDRCNDWEQKLDTAWRKNFRTEQALLIQLFKVQEERRTLRKDNEQLHHANAKLEEELHQANKQVDELNWELQQRTGEISLLKSHLKDEKEQVTSRGTELVKLRVEIKELQDECARLKESVESTAGEMEETREECKRSEQQLRAQLKEATEELERQRQEKEERIEEETKASRDEVAWHKEEISALKSELANTRSTMAELEKEFTREKAQWLAEKDKVIRYQKHLQLNYIQAMRKNKLLEDDVEQLTMELEHHNIKLMAQTAGEEGPAGRGITLMEEEESIC